jgi:hypothetical protein
VTDSSEPDRGTVLTTPDLASVDAGSWQASAATRPEMLAAWACSLIIALLIIGPLLAPGALFQLDRSLVPNAPFPLGTFGIGPEIPRDVPLRTILWFPGAIIGHVVVGKALMVLSITGAGAGMFRLARRCGRRLAASTAAILYATSPFLLTRLFVGHQAMWVVAATLPWVLPALTDRRRPLAEVFLACLALGLSGSYGGIVAWLVLLSATAWREPRRAVLGRLGVALAASAIWLVPGVAVVSSGTSIVSSSRFATGTDSIGDAFALMAGQGFWLDTYEVGVPNSLVAGVLGVILVVLAAVGTKRLPAAVRRCLYVLASGSLVLAAAPSAPLLGSLLDTLTSTPLGAPFREPQRYLLLYIFWMALAAPLGAQRLALKWQQYREALVLLPLAVAIVVSSYGWWGLNSDLQPTPIPAGWTEAREIIREGGGTTLALPWARYLPLRFAESSRSINPVPKFLGTDVLLSSDLGIGGESKERSESREDAADEIVRGLLELDTSSTQEQLEALGVRWIIVIHEGSYERFLPALLQLDLEPALIRPDIELYEVPGWSGEAITAGGDVVSTPRPGPPVASVDDERGFTWFRGYQAGWLRSASPVQRVGPGLFGVPAGSGPIWFWPSVLVMLTDVVVAAAATRVIIRSIRRPIGPE